MAERACKEGNPGLAVQLLETVRQKEEGHEDLRGPEWYHLWNACHGYAYALSGHNAPLTALEFSPDGRWIGGGAADGRIILWDALKARVHHVFTGPGAAVSALRFTEDCKILVAANEQEAFAAWDVVSGRELCTCSDVAPGEKDGAAWEAMQRLTHSQHERRQVANSFSLSSYSGQVGECWDSWAAGLVGNGAGFLPGIATATSAFSPPSNLTDYQGLVTRSMAFTFDNRLTAVSFVCDLGSAGTNRIKPGGVMVIDPARRTLLMSRSQSGPPISSVVLSPCGRSLAWGGEDRIIHACDLAWCPGELTLAFNSPARVLAFSHDRYYLASAHDDRKVRIWKMQPRQTELVVKATPAHVNNVVFSPIGHQLAASSQGTTKVWKVLSANQLENLWEIQSGRVGYGELARLAFSADGRLLSDGCTVTEVATGRELSRLKTPDGNVFGTAFSPDGKFVATAATTHVHICETATGTVLRTLQALRQWTVCIAYSPDGRLLAAGCADLQLKPGGIKVWEVATGREVFTYIPTHLSTFCLAFSPDGKWLAAGRGSYQDSERSFPGEVKIWDTGTWTEIMSLEGHAHCVWWVAFSPSGRRLASAAGPNYGKPTPAGEIKIWDLTAGQELLTINQAACVRGVSFSPNGKILASGAADGTVKLWGDLAGR